MNADLAHLLGRTVEVRVALVVVPPVPAVSPQLVQLALQPGNHPGEGRVAYLGAGPLSGVLTPLLAGTEVIVLIPEGDTKRCIVLGSLHSLRSPLPPTWTGLNNRFQHPLGNELRSAEGIPADGIVLGNFLVALQTYTTALSVFMASTALATTAPQIAAAAGVFQAATVAFLAALATSAAPNPAGGAGAFGIAPFAATLNRSTA